MRAQGQNRRGVIAVAAVAIVTAASVGLYTLAPHAGKPMAACRRLRALARSRAGARPAGARRRRRAAARLDRRTTSRRRRLRRRRRQATDGRRLQGPDDPAQPVGDLVRAVPRRDAGARPARGRARLAALPGRARRCRHHAPRQGTRLPPGHRRDAPQVLRRQFSADILQVLHGKGLPTSVLIGPDGCEIGTIAGPATWDSPEAKALVERVAQEPNGA